MIFAASHVKFITRLSIVYFSAYILTITMMIILIISTLLLSINRFMQPAAAASGADDHSAPKWAHEEANALLDFKAAAVYEYSVDALASWNAGVSSAAAADDHLLPCGGPITFEQPTAATRSSKWEGVYCGPDAEYVYSITAHNASVFHYYQMHVAGIELPRRSLSGSMSPSVGRLRFLRFLHLQGNSFSSIPPELGLCDHLTSLDLSSNLGFEVPIPVQLSNCSRLIRLNLAWIGSSTSTNDSAFIPSGLFRALSHLQYLNLSSTSSYKLLPAATELGNLSRSLTHLDLSFCKLFKGPLPDSIWDLPKLVHLDLERMDGNFSSLPKVFNFCRTIRYLSAPRMFLGRQEFPASLGNCTSLEMVDLSETLLTGIIPPEMWQLPNLSVLRLGTRYLSVFTAIVGEAALLSGSPLPKEFNFCSSFTIKELSLPRINLHGQEFPASLVNCTSLEVLDLWETGLNGTIPPEIWEMRANLSTLALGGSNSSYRLQMPSIPAGNLMSFCPTIATLIIAGIDFEGDGIVPPSLGSCSALNIIILTGNRLLNGASAGKPNNNSIPPEIGHLPVLHHLNLSSNGLSGPIPDELGDIHSSLAILDLSNNQLSGQLPASFQHLIHLQVLNLHRNKLSGGIEVRSLSRISSVIDLSHNLLSGFVNASAAEQHDFNGNPAGSLQILSLSFNKLSGGIPEWMWELPYLGMLDLSNNMLSGSLPNHMTKLTCMMSEGCGFGFQFVEDVGSFRDYIPIVWKSQEVPMSESVRENRIMLDLSNNKLEGEIPSSFGHLVGVKSLNLSHNKLRGAIPPQLGNLSALEALDISVNGLTGGIPVELAYLDALSSINVSYNRLEGPIPTQHNFDTRHALDASCFVGNLGLCGAPLPNACSPTNHTSPAPAAAATVINQQKEEDLLTRISDHVALGGVFLGFAVGFLGVLCFNIFFWRAASFKLSGLWIDITTRYRDSHP